LAKELNFDCKEVAALLESFVKDDLAFIEMCISCKAVTRRTLRSHHLLEIGPGDAITIRTVEP
jgi:hypothetical protein